MEYNALESETKGGDVFRLSGAYIYNLSSAIRPVINLRDESTVGEVYGAVTTAVTKVTELLGQWVIQLPSSRPPADALLSMLRKTQEGLIGRIGKEEWDKEAGIFAIYETRSKARDFEAVLLAELATADLYIITPKGGFHTTLLAENGIVVFPTELAGKVPESITDATQAARCLAFDLPTAAAFHLHRVHESVLRRYYDVATERKPHPEHRNIGAYIDAMKNHQVKDQNLFGTLATLKNFHRNPVMHPEDRLETIEEAIHLLGIINTSIGHMLKKLPPPELKLLPSPSESSE